MRTPFGPLSNGSVELCRDAAGDFLPQGLCRRESIHFNAGGEAFLIAVVVDADQCEGIRSWRLCHRAMEQKMCDADTLCLATSIILLPLYIALSEQHPIGCL